MINHRVCPSELVSNSECSTSEAMIKRVCFISTTNKQSQLCWVDTGGNNLISCSHTARSQFLPISSFSCFCPGKLEETLLERLTAALTLLLDDSAPLLTITLLAGVAGAAGGGIS